MLTTYKRDHGRGEDAHVQDVGSRGHDGRDDENHQNGVAEIPPHESGADDAHQRQKENQNRHLEDQSHAQNDAQKQRRVFADGDHGLELPAETDQEIRAPRDRRSCNRNIRPW